jgi:hypothetical protein
LRFTPNNSTIKSRTRDGIFLRVTGDYLDYRFSYSLDGTDWQPFGEKVDGAVLSPAVLGGFNYTGVYLGLYASSIGAPTENHADFDYFLYRPMADGRDDWFCRQSGSRACAASANAPPPVSLSPAIQPPMPASRPGAGSRKRARVASIFFASH